MADLPPYPASDDDTEMETGRESPTSTPRWVKVLGLIAIILVLLFITLHLTFGGLKDHRPQSNASERGRQQP